MFRLLLILCLTLSTAWGPLCCCCVAQVREAATAAVSKRPACCRQKTAAVQANPLKRVAAAQQSLTATQIAASDSSVPSQSCPCGVKAALGKALVTKAASLDTSEGWTPVSIDAVAPPVVLSEGVRLGEFPGSPPTALYGRSLLRAYHILRC